MARTVRRRLSSGRIESTLVLSPRERALETIRVEVAKTGKIGPEGVRAYGENKISYKAMMDAAADGLKIPGIFLKPIRREE